MQLCAQWFMTFRVASDSTPGLTYDVTFEQGQGPSCTCPSHARSKTLAARRPGWVPSCKHVVRVMLHACLWSDSYVGGDQTLSPCLNTLRATTSAHICPQCSGPCVEITR